MWTTLMMLTEGPLCVFNFSREMPGLAGEVDN